MRPDRRTLGTGALALLIGWSLPSVGRPASLLIPIVVIASTVVVAHRSTDGRARAVVATIVGAGPALILHAAVLDASGATPPAGLQVVMLQTAWWIAASTLGAAAARRIPAGRSLADVLARSAAVGAVTAFIAGALTRLLGAGFGTAERLAWILGEEDNAQIVGIAREVLTDGPRGAALAEQYGTAFVTLPLSVIRMLGGPLASESDVRLQAVTVFLVSTIVIIIVAGIAMALLSAFPQHVHDARGRQAEPSALRIVVGSTVAAIAALVSFSLLVVLPMRTGFLTFVWGLALVLLGAALAAATPPDAPVAARLVLVLHLVATGVLLLSSWPFIGPALLPLLVVPVLWARWDVLRSTLRHRPAAAGLAGVLLLVGAGSLLVWFLRWGPAAEVLSYGVDLLTVGGSGIFTEDAVRRAMVVTTVASALAIASGTRGRSRGILVAAILGPVAGASILYAGMRGASNVLTGGELGYAGVKLVYGVITLAAVLSLSALGGLISRRSLPVALGVLVLVVGVHQAGSTASLYRGWWDGTLREGAAHAEAVVDAIRSTNADLPIRCLPAPGTSVTDTTRWAAYFCARWMEDAFNAGRFDGRRFDLLNAEGPTFEATVARIEAEQQSEYLFAHRMTMGLGWFGWDGRAD